MRHRTATDFSRRAPAPAAWPQTLLSILRENVSILLCPTDVTVTNQAQTIGDTDTNNIADNSPRTYMINGANGLFLSNAR